VYGSPLSSSHFKIIDRRRNRLIDLTVCYIIISITDHKSYSRPIRGQCSRDWPIRGQCSVPAGGDGVRGAVQAVGGLRHDLSLGLPGLAVVGADPLGLGAGLFRLRLRERPLGCAFWCCDLLRFFRMLRCQPVSVLNWSLKYEDNEKYILTGPPEKKFLWKLEILSI